MNWTPHNYLKLEHGLIHVRATFSGEGWTGSMSFGGACYRHELKAQSLEAAKLEAIEHARTDLLEARDAIDSGLRDLGSEPSTDCELDEYDKLAWEMTRNRVAKLATDPNRTLINDRAHAQACAAVSLLAEELRTTGYRIT